MCKRQTTMGLWPLSENVRICLCSSTFLKERKVKSFGGKYSTVGGVWRRVSSARRGSQGSTKEGNTNNDCSKLLPHSDDVIFCFFPFNTMLLHLHKVPLGRRQFVLFHCQRCNVPERPGATDWYHWPLTSWRSYAERNLGLLKTAEYRVAFLLCFKDIFTATKTTELARFATNVGST